MKEKEKTALANKLLAGYEKKWGRKVPERITKWWSKGEAWKLAGKCLKGHKLSGYSEKATFGLAPCIPDWDVLANTDGLDDAVVGTRGDWKHAGDYIPLFHADSNYICAYIKDEKCPVGFFIENIWSQKGKGYVNGVYMLADSLDDFVKGLVQIAKPEFESNDGGTWEEAADMLEDDDEDDEDDED